MSVRDSYVEYFGEDQAAALEEAIKAHAPSMYKGFGSDPFKTVLAHAIGYDCVTKYPEAHGITVDPESFIGWVRGYGGLDSLVNLLVTCYGWFDPSTVLGDQLTRRQQWQVHLDNLHTIEM